MCAMMWRIALIHALLWTCVTSAGTTQNIQEIFLGKCWEYHNIIYPEGFHGSKKNCDDLWDKFHDAFAYKTPCNVTEADYKEFAEAARHQMPPDKHLFWESVYPFVNQYSAADNRYMTVSLTLLGYMANTLTWCGQEESPGINYNDCPTRLECSPGDLADYAYWKAVSSPYAQEATGIVNVMLNGSFRAPFTKNSIFATRELIYLKPEYNVTHMEIIVVHNLGGPITESCGEGSLLQLEQQAKNQGLTVNCENNPQSARHFQCVDHPDAAECSGLDLDPPSGAARHDLMTFWTGLVLLCMQELLK